MTDWQVMETKETLYAAWNGSTWDFNGNLSELAKFVLSEEWVDNIGAEGYEIFWKKVLKGIEGQKSSLEITLDMEFTFGLATEEDVLDYMKANNSDGPRLLVMHSNDGRSGVSMTSAYMRDISVKPLEDLDV